VVEAPQHHIHRHPKGHSGEPVPHPEDATHFFQDVARRLEDADAILLMGPASAKIEFFKYLQGHHAALAQRVIGLETVDHPSDPQIAALSGQAFAKAERLGFPAVTMS
jgi:stalled ribosome rescue protein Dom34